MADETPRPEELARINHNPPLKQWMDVPAEIKKGIYCYASNPKSVEYTGLPNPRPWNPIEDDWKLPKDWKKIIKDGMADRLDRFRSLKLFMDICVRCGACADKCHFFLGTGDPKNMPVLRAELLRSVYRNDFTTAGQNPRPPEWGAPHEAGSMCVLKEWWYYLSSSAPSAAAVRSSVRMASTPPKSPSSARELLNLLGLNIDWIATPVANCYPHRQPSGHPAARLQGYARILLSKTSRRSPAMNDGPQF